MGERAVDSAFQSMWESNNKNVRGRSVRVAASLAQRDAALLPTRLFACPSPQKLYKDLPCAQTQ